ncbi:hypothetical protein GGX14DRAFT_619645 [Mycena pura]|uniref:Protein kinase domain-containing protein n=1 Tax=Mycena pura TaxID=153505 RepID=A0AAD6VPM2_9AGAR|nr:hypothetical protein GGX14DRAFT_619645 [Mycena pura]
MPFHDARAPFTAAGRRRQVGIAQPTRAVQLMGTIVHSFGPTYAVIHENNMRPVSWRMRYDERGMIIAMAGLWGHDIGCIGFCPLVPPMVDSPYDVHRHHRPSAQCMTMLKTECGTPSYLAPEVVTQQNDSGYDSLVDSGDLVFHDFIKKLFEFDPQQPMKLSEALHHPWLKNCSFYYDVVDYPQTNGAGGANSGLSVKRQGIELLELKGSVSGVWNRQSVTAAGEPMAMANAKRR